jgi:uncharacterized integral membrane protein
VSDAPGTRPAGPRIERWKLILWGAIALYALLFLVLNDKKQSVNFVFFTINTRLIWLILLSMAIGAARSRKQ